MVMGVIELALVLAVLGLFAAVGLALWNALQRGATGPLPSRQRAELAAAIAQARWMPGHDEVDGMTRVLVRRGFTRPDGPAGRPGGGGAGALSARGPAGGGRGRPGEAAPPGPPRV